MSETKNTDVTIAPDILDKKQHEIATRQEVDLPHQNQAENWLQMIERAVRDPSVDIEKMERLLAMIERREKQEREAIYNDAMADCQADIPQIQKDGKIIVKGQERSRFARLEDIDVQLRPYTKKYGFSVGYDTKRIDDKHIEVLCKVGHRKGHSETKSIPLAIDVNEFRTNSQSVSATISFAKRVLLGMHFNLVTRGEDTGGAALEPISDEQAKDLEALRQEVGADKQRFLKFMEVESIDKILKKDHLKAVSALESKRRKS